MNILSEILHFFFSPPYYLNIDPIMFKIFSLEVRWYSMPYILGILFVYLHFHRLKTIKRQTADDVLMYSFIGVIVGARLGIAIFYHPEIYFKDPIEIFKLWHGGMSFHGALLGGAVAFYVLAKKHKEKFLLLFDEQAYVTSFFIALGRLANFVNGELYGIPTGSDWGVIFPKSGNYLPRHPSQLYEALAEGIIPFMILIVARKFYKIHNYQGLASGIAFILYFISRCVCELYRLPEKVYFGVLSMGQILTIPMLPLGIYMILRSLQSVEKPKQHQALTQ